MIRLFISHSIKDRYYADRLAAWLQSQGYESVFLDYDPQIGIPAGRVWHVELHRQLVGAKGVIFLCSQNWLSSHWCFAEAVYAKLEGKEFFPIEIEPGSTPELLRDRQAIFLHAGEQEALARLLRGLKQAGLDPSNDFAFLPSRSVYPGFASFDVEDAAVFYGRADEIRALLDLFNVLRDRREDTAQARLIVMLGASGCGKSSLARAGVLARLKKDKRWSLLPPLEARKGQLSPPMPTIVSDAVGAAQVLFIDQFEQLLVGPSIVPRELRMLLERLSPPLAVLVTLRSDHFAIFQQHPDLQHLPYLVFPVGPIRPDALDEVIRHPALRAGVDFAQTLVDRLKRVFNSDDSLPLLSYVLRDIFERGAGQTELPADLFIESAGLAEFLERRSTAILAGAPPESLEAFDRCLLGMVDEMDGPGRYVRASLETRHIPAAGSGLLKAFTDQRFLVSRDSTITLAHERLLVDWKYLRTLLEKERDFVGWRKRLRTLMNVWDSFGQNDDNLLPETSLPEAETWAAKREQAIQEEERSFIRSSRARIQKRKASEQAARSRMMRIYAAAACVAVVLGVVALFQSMKAARQGEFALANALEMRVAELQKKPGRMQNTLVLLAIEAARRNASPDTLSGLYDAITRSGRVVAQFQHNKAVTQLAFTPDGEMLLSGSDDGTVRVWSVTRGAQLSSVSVAESVRGLQVNSDGSTVAARFGTTTGKGRRTEESTGQVIVWRLKNGILNPVTSESFEKPVRTVRISDRTKQVLAADRSTLKTFDLLGNSGWTAKAFGFLVRDVSIGRNGESAALWSAEGVRVVETATLRTLFARPQARIQAAVFSEDGAILAVGKNPVRFFQLPSGAELPAIDAEGGSGVLSPDGRYYVAFDFEGADLWDRLHSDEILEKKPKPAQLGSIPIDEEFRQIFPQAAFSSSGYAIISPGDYSARVYVLPSGTELFRAGEDAQVRSLSVSPDARYTATGSAEGHITVWNLSGHLGPKSPGGMISVAFGAEGRLQIWSNRVSSAIVDQTGRTLWTYPTPKASVSADGHFAAAWSDKTLQIRDLQTGVERSIQTTSKLAAVGFRAKPSALIAVTRDGTARIEPLWSGSAEEFRVAPVVESERLVFHAVVSPRGRYVVMTAAEDKFVLADVASHKPLSSIQAETFWGATFSPDESQLAYLVEGNGHGRTFNTMTTRPGKAGWNRLIEVAAFGSVFSPDGGVLIISGDRNLRAFRAADGTPFSFLHRHLSDVKRASFSADSRFVVAVCEEGFVHIWRVMDQQEVFWSGPNLDDDTIFDPDSRYVWLKDRYDGATPYKVGWQAAELIGEGCLHTPRNLLASEWTRFLADERRRKTCESLPLPDDVKTYGK